MAHIGHESVKKMSSLMSDPKDDTITLITKLLENYFTSVHYLMSEYTQPYRLSNDMRQCDSDEMPGLEDCMPGLDPVFSLAKWHNWEGRKEKPCVKLSNRNLNKLILQTVIIVFRHIQV